MSGQISTLEKIVSLCKRRGFIYQSSDIYGGLQGVYDYGPLGVELKNNLKAAWWQSMLYERDDIEGLDSAILVHSTAMKNSLHESTFADSLVDCRKCKHRMRQDHIIDKKCSICGSKDLTEARQFNLMLKTHLGPIENDKNQVYLRPETAQGIFLNFNNILSSTARSLPFGIAQIGKAFRNEITPKHFIFRVREFEQMELEFFVEPSQAQKWYEYWVNSRYKWWIEQGISKDKLLLKQQQPNELAHYAKNATDILFKYPQGYDELEGIANRTDFDIKAHFKKDTYPYVIEPSAGVDRGILALLVSAYNQETLSNQTERTVLKLKPALAPIKATVIPLARNNPKLIEMAIKIKTNLMNLKIGRIGYENTGNIGKAYRKNDEIGTPFCITVDFNSIDSKKNTLTIRHRDTMQQETIDINNLTKYILERFKSL